MRFLLHADIWYIYPWKPTITGLIVEIKSRELTPVCHLILQSGLSCSCVEEQNNLYVWLLLIFLCWEFREHSAEGAETFTTGHMFMRCIQCQNISFPRRVKEHHISALARNTQDTAYIWMFSKQRLTIFYYFKFGLIQRCCLKLTTKFTCSQWLRRYRIRELNQRHFMVTKRWMHIYLLLIKLYSINPCQYFCTKQMEKRFNYLMLNRWTSLKSSAVTKLSSLFFKMFDYGPSRTYSN